MHTVYKSQLFLFTAVISPEPPIPFSQNITQCTLNNFINNASVLINVDIEALLEAVLLSRLANSTNNLQETQFSVFCFCVSNVFLVFVCDCI